MTGPLLPPHVSQLRPPAWLWVGVVVVLLVTAVFEVASMPRYAPSEDRRDDYTLVGLDVDGTTRPDTVAQVGDAVEDPNRHLTRVVEVAWRDRADAELPAGTLEVEVEVREHGATASRPRAPEVMVVVSDGRWFAAEPCEGGQTTGFVELVEGSWTGARCALLPQQLVDEVEGLVLRSDRADGRAGAWWLELPPL